MTRSVFCWFELKYDQRLKHTAQNTAPNVLQLDHEGMSPSADSGSIHGAEDDTQCKLAGMGIMVVWGFAQCDQFDSSLVILIFSDLLRLFGA